MRTEIMAKKLIDEKFAPHPNLKKLYFIYLALASAIPLTATSIPIFGVYILAPEIWRVAWLLLIIPLGVVFAVICFLAYWIPKYFDSISFTLTQDEVIVERGVWWKMKHVVPYARVMSVDAIQGPISRHFGLGCVDIHTAGYTGPGGGTAGPRMRRAEASIWGVPNFMEIRDTILSFVRGRPLFAARGAGDPSQEILRELRKIRESLEKRRAGS